MNTTKNPMIAWLKRGAVIALVLTCALVLNVSIANATVSSSSASASASASASSVSTGSGSASAAAAASAATVAVSNSNTAAAAAAAASAAAASSAGNGSSAAAASAAAASAYANTNFHPVSLSASCSASASSVSVGSQVSFYAHSTGGNGNYTYSWSGTDGLFGNGSSVSRTYNSAGSKTAMVRVVSGSSSASASCSVSVNNITPPPPPPPPANLNGSCVANTSNAQIGDTVNWSANGVTGGNGNYIYSWSGSEGLSGSGLSVSKAYSFAGSKTATLTITSGNQHITRNCFTYVNPVVVPNPVAINGSCVANTSSAEIGDTVNWSATGVTGGNGNYSYSWSGSEGLSGNGSSVSKSYATSGSKSAALTITSGTQHITRNCNTYISSVIVQPETLSGSCSANTSNPEVGDTVYWSANVSGGNGNYSYSWSGSEGLHGNSQTVSDSYSYSGSKTATVTIHSGNQSISRSCYTYVDQEPYVPPYNPPHYNNLSVSCSANQSSAYVGDSIYWSADASGGNGNYSYSWSGTDGLYGNNYSAYRSYNTAGTKYANLTVYSNGQSVTRTCSVYVNNRYAPITYAQPTYPTTYQPTYVAPTNYGGVSLSQVPYTGLESNLKVILFTLALIAWSAIVTYIVLLRKRNKLAFATVSTGAAEAVSADDAQQFARQEVLMGQSNMLDDLQSFARSKNVIISADALEAIADMSGNDQNRAEALLSSLANRHANGTDWTTLDFNKVQSAVG